MGKTLAYIATSTDKQNVRNKRRKILEVAEQKGINVDKFIESSISPDKISKHLRLDEILQNLENGDTLMVTELSYLGVSTVEVITLVEDLLKRGVRVIAVKQNLDAQCGRDIDSNITAFVFSFLAELERDIISLRAPETNIFLALASAG